MFLKAVLEGTVILMMSHVRTLRVIKRGVRSGMILLMVPIIATLGK
jgi:hypothetical protein